MIHISSMQLFAIAFDETNVAYDDRTRQNRTLFGTKRTQMKLLIVVAPNGPNMLISHTFTKKPIKR